MQLTRPGRFLRRSIKRFIYSQLALRESLMIFFRKSAPLVLFNVEDDPPSIYINFRIRPDRLQALADELDLPGGLALAPIRCIDGEAPFHVITLNAYRVSGLVNGVRAEWSVYVRDAEGVPRYLVVEAQSDVFSMDPVNIVTRAGSMEHVLEGDRLHTRITSGENQGEVVCEARLPAVADREAVRAAPERIEANDYIYWRNGVCDRTFYDAALANAPLWRVPLESLQIQDGSVWAEFIDPEPVHALLLSKRVQFAMSPWWSL
jgi:hypothetical protein